MKKVTEGDFARAHELAWKGFKNGDQVSTCARDVFARLGIEIVPDPEPEPPPKPWRLDLGPEPLTARIRDANDKIIVEVRLVNEGANIPDQVRWLMALVSAYNAAGERKRIETERAFGDSPTYGNSVYKINGELCSARSRNEAIGSYAKRHASDLGLEIVES